MVEHKHVLVLSCLAIVLSPAKSQTYQCSVCPVGKYKSATQNAACLQCPAHTYQDVLGATSVTQCKPCPTASFSGVGSSSISACLCAAGYSGDVGNYSVGVPTANLAAACTGACVTLSNRNNALAGNAIDADLGTSSWSDTVAGGDTPQFQDMKPWWRVQFEREAVVQAVDIQNYNAANVMSFHSSRE